MLTDETMVCCLRNTLSVDTSFFPFRDSYRSLFNGASCIQEVSATSGTGTWGFRVSCLFDTGPFDVPRENWPTIPISMTKTSCCQSSHALRSRLRTPPRDTKFQPQIKFRVAPLLALNMYRGRTGPLLVKYLRVIFEAQFLTYG